MPTDTFESLAASDTIGGIFVVQFNTSAWLWCRDWDLSHIYGVEPATGSQSATSGRIGMVDDGGSFNLYMLRAFLNFDTSALPDNATITGVTLRLYVSAKQDTGSASPTIGVTGYTGTNTPAQWDANSASQTLWTSVTATELATRVALSRPVRRHSPELVGARGDQQDRPDEAGGARQPRPRHALLLGLAGVVAEGKHHHQHR